MVVPRWASSTRPCTRQGGAHSTPSLLATTSAPRQQRVAHKASQRLLGGTPLLVGAVWIMLSLRASSRKSSNWLCKNNLRWAAFQVPSMFVDLYAFDAVVQGHHRLAGR